MNGSPRETQVSDSSEPEGARSVAGVSAAGVVSAARWCRNNFRTLRLRPFAPPLFSSASHEALLLGLRGFREFPGSGHCVLESPPEPRPEPVEA